MNTTIDKLAPYKTASSEVLDFIQIHNLQDKDRDDEIKEVLTEFHDRFAPEKLAGLRDDEILETLFFTEGDVQVCLAQFLEFDKRCKRDFGSISGGSSFKFGLFQRKENGQWMSGSANKQVELSEDEALAEGKKIRDAFVKGAEVIRTSTLESLEDYEVLDRKLNSVTEGNCNKAWFHKYFFMLFPEKFSTWHSTTFQNHLLCGLGIEPSSYYYGRCGQLAMVRKLCNISNQFFGEVLYEMFGNIKEFVRLGSSTEEGKYGEEMFQDGEIGIGWNEIGNLQDLEHSGGLNKEIIRKELVNYYYPKPTQAATATKKADEILNFFNADQDTVFVIVDGEKLIGIADCPGEYIYDSSKALGHRRKVNWICFYDENMKLPYPKEKNLTTCSKLNKTENIRFLYNEYYAYKLGKQQKQVAAGAASKSFESKFERNRIVFGAPGTGKSYTLKKDAENLLENTKGSLERVTFHPDYTYSQFIGTYKPVTDFKGDIRYEFVPGPFMRVYVKAVKSLMSEYPQPQLLLIEEINRARVSAVFGDVFQLLDRDEDGKSEYSIVTSEDIRGYLAKELGGNASDYEEIKIPSNMYIWATMNSADQGVFPMDTAFKRRWDFEYLGIDSGETEMENGIVVLGTGDSEKEINWNQLRKAINEKLSGSEFRINEDKLLGPFFLSKKVTRADENGMIIDPEAFIDAFKSKIIMYLYEDAAKQYRAKLFSGCDSLRYSSICDSFDEIGIGIFGDGFEDLYDQQEG